MSQRSVGFGAIATRLPAASSTASSSTRSSPPQAPGPANVGFGVNTAMAASRLSQSVGGPCSVSTATAGRVGASAVWVIDGRGCGKGTPSVGTPSEAATRSRRQKHHMPLTGR